MVEMYRKSETTPVKQSAEPIYGFFDDIFPELSWNINSISED